MAGRKVDTPPILGKLEGEPPCSETAENEKQVQEDVGSGHAQQPLQPVLGAHGATDSALGDGNEGSIEFTAVVLPSA